MRNQWLKQSNSKLKIDDFIFRNIGHCGAIYEVQHPMLKEFSGEDLVPLYTRIAIHPDYDIHIVWSPEAAHRKMVKAKAEAIKEELLARGRKQLEIYFKHHPNPKSSWQKEIRNIFQV